MMFNSLAGQFFFNISRWGDWPSSEARYVCAAVRNLLRHYRRGGTTRESSLMVITMVLVVVCIHRLHALIERQRTCSFSFSARNLRL